jgi:DNA polymerase-3 subunit alpha
MELLGYEKEALGLYLSGHPIDRHADDLRLFGARTVGDLTLGELPPSTDGSPGRVQMEDVHVGGIVSGLRPLKTKKGDAMCVFALEDYLGTLEVVVFPETYARFRAACENGALLLVRGKFERDEESSRLQATEVVPLAQLRERLSRGVRIRLKADTPRETIGRLWDVVSEFRGDRPLAIEVVVNGGAAHTVVRMDINPSIRVRPSEQFVTTVEKLCGQGTVIVH